MIQQTSLLAYREVKLGERQKQVLEALEEIQPATNKQIAKHLGMEINSVTPRCLELRVKGRVVKHSVGKDESGRSAIYWSTKGYKVWDEQTKTL